MTSRDAVRTIIFESVAKVFGVSKDSLHEGMSALDVDGWDSVSTSHLLLEIEERLGRELDLETTLEAENLGEMIDVISRPTEVR